MKNRAAMYLRSSKDRKDVSIQDQRELLLKVAAERGLAIAAEFVDVVESGKDEDRPGFQQLLAAIGNNARGWDHLLCRDTSRLARGTWLCGIIDYEAHKRGVRVVYANVPDTDAMTQVMLVQIYRAQDQIHSMMSRDKGLAGMRQNVMRGFRAGGRAPWGYRLRSVGQGIVRDGREVQKSVLEPSDDAAIVTEYLQRRARGEPRAAVCTAMSIERTWSSLVGVEWNALTYAGCTVWNVHRDHTGGQGYRGQSKRRPRNEWVITEHTHPALITRTEAERLVSALEESDVGAAISAAKRAVSPHLLSSLLYSPDGQRWEANRDYYRLRRPGGRSKHVRIDVVDAGVRQALMQHLTDDAAIAMMREHSPATSSQIVIEPRQQLQARIASLARAISRAMDAALQLDDPAPALRKVDELERERKRLARHATGLDTEAELQRAARLLPPARIRELLNDFVSASTPADLKALVEQMLARVTLDPETLECQLHIALEPQSWASVASPRGFEPRYLP